jgi:hypothetical protein
MKFRKLHFVLPFLGGFAACTLTTSLDGLQGGGGAGGSQGGQGGLPGGSGGSLVVTTDAGASAVGAPDTAPVIADNSLVIVSQQKGLRGIAFNKVLYWVDAATPAIWTADKDGAAAKMVLTSMQKVDTPFDVEAADQYLFWTELSSGFLWRAIGTNTSILGPKVPRAGFVTAFDDFTVLVSDLDGDANGKTIWKQGTRLYSRTNAVRGLAHVGDFIYWAEPTAIFRGAKDGSEPIKEALAIDASGVATNGLEIFWIDRGGTELMQQTLGNKDSKKVIFRATKPQSLFDVAASSTFVYWTDPGTGTIRRLGI